MVADKAPQAAVLDININGRTSFELAECLDELGIPFIFLSAYVRLDPRWRAKPLCPKPCDPAQLKALLASSLAGHASQAA